MEGFLQGARYWLAVFLVACFPGAVLYWYLIHPFANFWRRLGTTKTFLTVGVVCLVVTFAIASQHEMFMAKKYTFNWPLALIGLALYGIAAYLEVTCRKLLKFKILAGVPEVGNDPGRLLTEGIFNRTRNPRYLAILFGVGGWTLILNYPALYILFALSCPAVYVLILLEERELIDRFGAEYEAYLARVPRLFPRLSSL